MVMPIGGLISGLTVIAGGIAGIVFGTQANEREAGSGQAMLTGGITAIIAGAATATAGITAIGRKIAEVMARDDGNDNDNAALDQTNQVLSQLAVEVDNDANKVRETAEQSV
ncbi:MAG TPA: hypothetical protein VFV67_11585 [Actinophytocola sp.]|uniref:hypothetical protein n=1 Tax=Actinophytocola sp. TaxID=1872138 RepID=UPI002DBB0031|nr:hypothetical protein [Actinophytocola sp.]HEU5471287.1 hypothetical protein [Actinophytocola sp.]